MNWDMPLDCNTISMMECTLCRTDIAGGVPEEYGPESNQLSACNAEFLAVHPYFNPNVQPEATVPTIELISPRTYPAGAENVSIQLK